MTHALRRTVVLLAALLLRPDPASCEPRHIPIRWIELHATRHAECQCPTGSVVGPLPTIDPRTWTPSDSLHWIIGRMNDVYAGTGIDFWLQSHEVYCTRVVADFLTDANGKAVPEQLLTKYVGSEVWLDLAWIFPNADPDILAMGGPLRRERWLQRAFALFGDRHAFPVFVHSDYVDAVGSPTLAYSDTDGGNGNDFVLPQHGYFPWESPGLAFLFLSGGTWAANWQFDPELAVAHEVGHALGNLHTIDFDGTIGAGAFPDGSKYEWADHWDLIYAQTPSGVRGFANRAEVQQWVATNGTTGLKRIDDHWNVTLDTVTGRMTVQLGYDPTQVVSSETLVASAAGSMRLLHGLSFELAYSGGTPPHPYAWQRNLMSYRYPKKVFLPADTKKVDEIDPYDHLTARFSASQRELMQRQLQGSTPFTVSDYGAVPPGKGSLLATRFDLLGDGAMEDFVWYSNGEGPASVDSTDNLPDVVAFRAAPAPEPVNFGPPQYRWPDPFEITPTKIIAGDFNGDGLDDLFHFEPGPQARKAILWATRGPGALAWEVEVLGDSNVLPKGYTPLAAGDFDGNGADDLFFVSGDGKRALILNSRKAPRCRDFSACRSNTLRMSTRGLHGQIAVGNYDARYGDDVLWASTERGETRAHVLWSTADGELAQGGTLRLGRGRYVPYAGNFNGTGGDDVLWVDATGRVRLWWGLNGEDLPEQQFLFGPGGSSEGADSPWNMLVGEVGPLAVFTIGDFDGNGADDIMVRNSDEPLVLFSEQSGGTTPSCRRLRVALHNSRLYHAVVGEFDGGEFNGKRLGDDLLLLYP